MTNEKVTVKIIAGLIILIGIMGILTGLAYLGASDLGSMVNFFILSYSLIILIISIFFLIIGINFWKLKKWAKTTLIILLVIVIINSLFNLFALLYSNNNIFINLTSSTNIVLIIINPLLNLFGLYNKDIVIDTVIIIISLLIVLYLLKNKKVKELFNKKQNDKT